ncbi:hypothetical protein KX431_26945, partial [Escherichia coli]|nr:hypothetical protein [Escherichia coli]
KITQTAVVAYSINTRIARAIAHQKCAFFERFSAQQNNTQKPLSRQYSSRFSHRFSEQQNRFAGGWSHCVTPTTITSVFSRTVVNHKIGTHAGGAGPHDFLFDESENGER